MVIVTLYHVNPKTGNPGVCRAKVQCRFGSTDEHYGSPEEARQAYEASRAQRPGSKAPRKPVLVEPSSLPNVYEWNLVNNFAILDNATDSDLADYYSTDYTEPSTLDLDVALEVGLGLRRSAWPSDLMKLVEANRDEWADVSNWAFENGYYEGDDPEFAPPKSIADKLEAWYYARPNAVDPAGVLEHVREKGYATTGCDPVAAVKKMLREENNMVLSRVENAVTVTVAPMVLSHVSFAKHHYDQIEPAEPKQVSPRSKQIMGVIMGNNGHYRLLDGHHRLKWANNNDVATGTFIVLH